MFKTTADISPAGQSHMPNAMTLMLCLQSMPCVCTEQISNMWPGILVGATAGDREVQLLLGLNGHPVRYHAE